MTTSNGVKWLLVGTGDIVRKRVASAIGSNLVGVCGGRQRAQAIADEHGGAKVYDDIDAALADTDANAVYIATPVYRHHDEAVKACAAGKHVLIEKPLGLDGADAMRIVEAAVKAKVTAGCAYYRRCAPRFAHLKKLIDEQTLGRIVLVRTSYWGWFSPTTDDPKYWRVERGKGGGGPLADMGSHMFDILIGLLGMPKAVFAHCDTLANDYEVEDSSAIVMTLDGGVQVTASFGWNSKTWRHDFEVVGTEGKVLWLPADAGKVVVTMGRDVEEIDLPPADNVHRPLIEDFEQAVASSREPIAPVAEAAKTNLLLDAIYRSADSGAKVSL